MTATDQPHQLRLNGGVFPEPDGTWRVVIWLTGARSEAEANDVSSQVHSRLTGQPPPSQPPRPNGSPEPPQTGSGVR
jgi:hypothetical protein